MIAAFIVLAVVAGHSGVADLLKQTRWRVGSRGYLHEAFLSVHLCALVINLSMSARIVNSAHVARTTYATSLAPRSPLTPAVLILAESARSESGWINDLANARSARAR